MSDDIYENEVMIQLMDRHPNVDFYIKHLPPIRKQALETLREKVHEWLPEVKESMQYRMPTYVTSDIVCAVASQKKIMSLYICHTEILDQYRAHFEHLKVGRSCIRFQALEDLPLEIVEIMIKKTAEVFSTWG